MTDRPILFSAPMIRAILDGRKTQTRRVIKNAPEVPHMDKVGPTGFQFTGEGGLPRIPFTPPYAAGDRLWVREAHRMTDDGDHGDVVYEVDKEAVQTHIDEVMRLKERLNLSDKWANPHLRKRPSIHMPRWASRLTLIVEDVRVQRLREITLGDICAEGLATSIYDFKPTTRGFDAWAELWDGLNAPRGYGWDANPWVVAITFRTIKANIDSEDVRNAA